MDIVIDAMTRFFEAFPAWINAMLSVVTAASALTALTPTTLDDTLLGKLRRLLDMLALNVGHAAPGGHADMPKADE